VLGPGLVWIFDSDFFGSGAVAAWTSFYFYDLGDLDSGYRGAHFNNIHFSHEKGVARISSLTGSFYEPASSWLGAGNTDRQAKHIYCDSIPRSNGCQSQQDRAFQTIDCAQAIQYA
jgi:hypothetical protein